jgi:hypothetical protein
MLLIIFSLFTSVNYLANLKNRRVIHFGYAFDYSLNAAVRPCTPIPEIFHKIISKFVDGGFFSTCNLPDQVTVNCYDAGQGIHFQHELNVYFSEC